MEKKDRILIKKYAPLIVYLDSLEKILSVLMSSCSKVEIETEDYKFESITELKDNFKNNYPKSLTIKSSNPYSKLILDSGRAEFYLFCDTIESSGVFYEINDILLKSQRRPNFIYSYYFVVFAPNIIFLAGNILPEYILDNFLFFLLQLFVYLWATWVVLFIRLKNHSRIILETTAEKHNFFQKHTDQIILSLIVAIITTIINFAGHELAKNLLSEEPKTKTDLSNRLQK